MGVQRAIEPIGLAGVIGDSARGQIGRGTWEIRRGWGGGLNARREDITAGRPRRKSERSIVASKRGNSRGAKGPRRRCVFVRREARRLKHFITEESAGQLDAGLPMTRAALRRKLALKAKRESKVLFVFR